MELLDKYLYAIKQKLTCKGKEDIIKELRASILDEIDAKYGSNPTEKQLKNVIESYGSPKEVSMQYQNNHLVIGDGYTDLYFLLIKTMILGICMAFTIAFSIELLSTGFTSEKFFTGLASIPFKIVQSVIIGVGIQTLIFIAITRYADKQTINLNENWSIDKLKDVSIGYKSKTKFESILTIVLLCFSIIILNNSPEIIKILEGLLKLSTIELKHTINLQVFNNYVWIISILWIGEITYHIISLVKGSITKKLAFYEIIIDILSVILIINMIDNKNLFVGESLLLGFKGILIITMFITIIEIIIKNYKFIKYFYMKNEN